MGWKLPWVMDANIMNARVAVLILLIAYCRCTFIMEQPVSSLFTRTPSWLYALRLLRANGYRVWRQCVHLGAFGATSQKTVHLHSNHRKLLAQLYRPLTFQDRARFAMSSSLVRRTVSKDGRRGVTWKKVELRASQVYPPAYGAAVAAAHLANPSALEVEAAAHLVNPFVLEATAAAHLLANPALEATAAPAPQLPGQAVAKTDREIFEDMMTEDPGDLYAAAGTLDGCALCYSL